MRQVLAMSFASLLVCGCVGSPAWKASQELPPSYNIRVVTHERLVEDLQFVDGFSLDVPPAFSISQTERLARYVAYERGHNDVVVLVDLAEVPDSGDYSVDESGAISLSGGRDGYAKVSVYSAARESTP